VRQRLFLVLVGVLPLHTVFLAAWISWKPFLVLTLVLAVWDLKDGFKDRTWPWHRRASLALALLLVVLATGFPDPPYRERFIRLLLAVVVGGLLMLVAEKSLREPGAVDRALRVVFWTGAGIGLTAVILSLPLLGLFGDDVINRFAEPPPFRFWKPAYLKGGFLALSNWHQDPGYSAAWAVLWGSLALIASLRGLGTRRWWLDGAVIGGLWYTSVMAFSRTGWVSFPLALAVTAALARRNRMASLGQAFKRIGIAAFSAAMILGAMFAVDVPKRGGDLDLQFAFRLRQGWDLLADITGLFASSEAFADRFNPSEERADVWPEYLAMFKSEPLTGVGLGVAWESNSIKQEPHNLVLELISESGLIGAAAFGLLMWVIISGGGGVIGAAALTAAFLHSVTQTVLFEPTWWFAAALLMSGKIGSEAPAA
jgi:hypothetical protein